MSRSTRLFQHQPRGMTRFDLAVYLRRSEGWVDDHIEALAAAGFPQADPLLGTWDKKAIDRWWDGRSGLQDATDQEADAELLRRLDAELPPTIPIRRRA